MAQAYDIYLNKRLTEFDIIIKNLPLRDGLVAHTKMYLDAMINYLYLQKFIVVYLSRYHMPVPFIYHLVFFTLIDLSELDLNCPSSA